MLREANEDLSDGIYICCRTDGSSLFNHRRLLAHTKTIEEVITELQFADDCALLAQTEETLRHTVNRFCDAAMNFSLTISPKKTEVLYQPSPRQAYSLPQFSIDGTNLNVVEHFTYLDSVISDDATVSKDLDKRLSKASSSFGRLSKRVWQSHSLRLPTKIQVYRSVFVPTLLYGAGTTGSRSGYSSGFTNAACAPSLASNGKTTCLTKKSSREPAYSA